MNGTLELVPKVGTEEGVDGGFMSVCVPTHGVSGSVVQVESVAKHAHVLEAWLVFSRLEQRPRLDVR